MNEFCTLEEVKQVFRVSTSDDDDLIQLLIISATGSVIAYLKDRAEQYIASGGSGEELPPPIKMATIILVGYWYRNPDRDPDQEYEQGYLPRPVTALLYPFRTPALR